MVLNEIGGDLREQWFLSGGGAVGVRDRGRDGDAEHLMGGDDRADRAKGGAPGKGASSRRADSGSANNRTGGGPKGRRGVPIRRGGRHGNSSAERGRWGRSWRCSRRRRRGGEPVDGTPGERLWQRDYYEHIVRSDEAMVRIVNYVLTNPVRWHLDADNPDRLVREPRAHRSRRARGSDPAILAVVWRSAEIGTARHQRHVARHRNARRRAVGAHRAAQGLRRGRLRVLTNYESAKGRILADNPRASLLIFWAALERQVRITGTVTKTSAKESESTFSRAHSRPIGAWASAQSRTVKDRAALSPDTQSWRHNMPVAPCRCRRSGADTAWRQRRSNSGRDARAGCTIDCCTSRQGAGSWSRSRLAP